MISCRPVTPDEKGGDGFLWACLAGLVAIVPWSLVKNLKRRSLQEAQAQQVPL